MAITKLMIAGCLILLSKTVAADTDPHHKGQQIFHAFWLEAQYGGGSQGGIAHLDLDGWIGGDTHKLWLKTETKQKKGQLKENELWAMYSRNIAEFWDFQAGFRHDTQPASTSYAVFGVHGLAPYFLKTDAHLFVSDYGDVTARLKQNTHLLFTQRFAVEPYYRLEMAAQRVARQDLGRGLTSGRLGLRFNYEISREFTPYLDVRYDRLLGGTARIASSNDQRRDNYTVSLGLKLMF
ncbi:MAG: copper resistance protein B [Methylophaga sp.]|nr:copper resistance protein B [Methylophaga sp.]